MSLDIEATKNQKEKSQIFKAVPTNIPMMNQNSRGSAKRCKRPEWHIRSPIQDVFVRYGEYFA